MSTIILDPTDERVPVHRTLAPRPGRFSGSIALLDISKPRGDVLLDRAAERLTAEFAGVTVNRYRKPTFAKPAPAELRQEILGANDFVIEALAD